MTVRGFNLYDMLVRNAGCFGDRVALITETGEERTFRELLQRVDRLSVGLAEGGLGKGDRLCILALNSAAYFELYLACARLGAVMVPLNWRLSIEELQRIVERAGPKGFAVDRASAEKLPVRPGEHIDIVLWIDLDDEPTHGFISIESLYVDDHDIDPPEVSADDPFAVIATAAVDIVPRGAVLTHGNVLASNVQEIAAMGLDETDRNLLALPLFHIAGLGHAFGVFHAGGALAVMPRFDAEKAVRLIDEHSLTHLSDFPPVLTSLLDAAEAAGSRLETLRHVTGLDAPDTIERLHTATRAQFWIGFGQAETSGFVTLQRFRDNPGCAGKPGSLVRLKLVDDHDQEVPVGSPGEILVRGPIVFQGYDGQPEISEHTFRGGWHHTGDVGRLDGDGNLYYVKRKPEKELIKPGGENVYPAEVETVILELDGVSAVCVIGVPDKKWGEGIKAVVETASESLDAQTIIDHVASRIARYKKPQYVDFTDQLPRNDDGEVERETVKERWGEVSRS